jgi:hypothetical protein
VNVAFNARFYGPWLAAVAGLLYVLRRAVSGPWTWRGAIALGVVSALVSTIHYFGILSWVMAVATAAALGRRSMLTITRRLLPALAGPIALGACFPIYFGQRAALTNATWVPAASLADHAFLLVTSFAALGLLVALAAWGASRVLRRVAPANAAPRAVASFGVGSWLLLSQMGVAFAVILVSLLVQPATQPRYWIPASLAVAPLTALAVSRSLRPLQFAALVATVVASFTFVAGEGADARAFAGQVSVDSSYAVRVVSEKSTLVARRRHTLYPLLRAYPPAASSAILFAGPSIGRDSNLVAMDVRIARVHERFYGFPHIASAAELEKRGSFYFLAVDSARSPSPHEFPGRTIERIAPRLFVIR